MTTCTLRFELKTWPPPMVLTTALTNSDWSDATSLPWIPSVEEQRPRVWHGSP